MAKDMFSSHPPFTPPTKEEDRLLWLRLIRSPRVGPTTFHRLMAEHGSAEAALNALPGIAEAAGVAGYTPCSEESARTEMELARAKGVSRARLLWIHGLKNAWLPVMTVLGIQAGYLLGGSVVIEAVFRLPGIGSLALTAIQSRDYVLLQGVILFVATTFLLINLTVDLLYAWIDPRVRTS